jgi:hypothetical protein
MHKRTPDRGSGEPDQYVKGDRTLRVAERHSRPGIGLAIRLVSERIAIGAKGTYLDSGSVGTAVLRIVLSKCGGGETIYALLVPGACPSWL